MRTRAFTDAPGTYTQLKIIATGSIPSPDPEPALSDMDPDHTIFNHFVDDDIGGSDTLSGLIHFLNHHYFPRLSWAKFTLNPAKCEFLVSNIQLLGHRRDLRGIRPSENKLGVFREYSSFTSKDELERFLYMLPFLKVYIPGRADRSTFLRTAIVGDIITTIREGHLSTRIKTSFFLAC